MKDIKTVFVAVTYEVDTYKGCKKHEICAAAKRGLKSLVERAEKGEIGLQGFKLIHCEAIG